jgi:hypothetical protein
MYGMNIKRIVSVFVTIPVRNNKNSVQKSARLFPSKSKRLGVRSNVKPLIEIKKVINVFELIPATKMFYMSEQMKSAVKF